MVNLVGGIAGAFNGALSRLSSQAPATAPPSGVALDTPVLDPPSINGYTNVVEQPILGSVPSDTVGKSGYTVHVYSIGANGSRNEFAKIEIGDTTRFVTPSVTLVEGSNKFVATLATPNGEGRESPPVDFILDTKPPALSISSPASGTRVSTSSVSIIGTSDPRSTIAVRNEMAPGGSLNNTTAGEDGKFRLTVDVVAGSNTIHLTSTDLAGNATNTSLVVKRDYGKLAAHLAVAPSKFAASSKATLKLTLRATTFNGGPLADAKVTFTVTVSGLGPIVSPELTTDATGTATWQVAVSGASAGSGQATVLVISDAGDQVMANAAITTT
jgi:hypothetical protein